MDPHKTMLVVKNSAGKEVGRIAATARNSQQRLDGLARAYGNITVDYVEDEVAAQAEHMIHGRREVPKQ